MRHTQRRTKSSERMIDWLKAILGIIVDDNEKLVALTDPMPEPEAEMWAQRLRAVGIGAAVQNLGLPPYTSSMSNNYTVSIRAIDVTRACEVLGEESTNWSEAE